MANLGSLSEHIIFMHGHLYLCTLCDFKTTFEVQLPDHVKACHRKCGEREEIFTNLGSLSKYISVMHGQMYLCNLCGFRTTSYEM